MGSEIRKPDRVKSRQMVAILSKTIGYPDKNVWISNGPVFEGWMVGTIAIAIAKA